MITKTPFIDRREKNKKKRRTLGWGGHPGASPPINTSPTMQEVRQVQLENLLSAHYGEKTNNIGLVFNRRTISLKWLS